MAFDYKKEYKEFYLPSRKPHLITVPPMNFVTVQGKGDPNDPAGGIPGRYGSAVRPCLYHQNEL